MAITFLIAASPDTGNRWIGVGGKTCASFAQDFKRDPDLAEITYFSWAQGFMSGLNTHHAGAIGGDDSTNLMPGSYPVETQEHFIQEYCDEHPLGWYVGAVLTLWFDMRKSQGLPITSEAGP